MNEATIVGKIHDAFKRQLPKAVYLKLNDMSTTGIPDLAITYGGHTLFVEVKLLKEKETPSQFKKHFSGLQLTYCRLLEREGRCCYLIAYQKYGATYALIVKPHRLAYFLEKGGTDVAGLQIPGETFISLAEAIDHLVFMARRS